MALSRKPNSCIKGIVFVVPGREFNVSIETGLTEREWLASNDPKNGHSEIPLCETLLRERRNVHDRQQVYAPFCGASRNANGRQD
jgi:hypothetical protein